MILTPKIAEKIKRVATQLFLDKQFTEYSAELQATVCTVLAAQQVLAAEGVQFQLEPQLRQPYESIDTD